MAEHKHDEYSFASHSDKTALIAGSGTTERPTLRSVDDAETLLNDSLTDLFSNLAD